MQNPSPRAAIRRFVSTSAASGSLAIVLTAFLPNSTQTAVANGDTRTINLFYVHTNETISATFRVNGSYDAAVLDRLNWFLRDWRRNEPTKMDPRLFDAIWEAQRGAGSTATVKVMSAYRSPETNSMLRRRSRAVAEHSQHIQGRAMDIHVDDVPMSAIRETAVRMQRGGVGYYPTSGTPFVHIDVGSVRAWPRLNYDQLARLFPDGKTVHIPSNGQPLARYEEARAEIAARGGAYAPTLAQVKSKGFFATLFGWNEDDEDVAPVQVARRAPAPIRTASMAPAAPVESRAPAAAFRSDADRGNPQQFSRQQASPPPQIATASLTPMAQPRGAPLTIAALDMKYPDVPMPPRRPSEAQVLALIASAVPLPPQRPTDLIVLAKAETSTQPASRPSATSRDAVAALIGATNSGNVAATPGLPAVITQGAPVVASAGSGAGLLAFASLQKEAPKPAPVATRQRNAPIVAHRVAVPMARDAKINLLVAARLDRSNFMALVAPASISDTPVASLLGSTVAPLRTSARNDVSKIIFAPAMPLQTAAANTASLPVQGEDAVASVAIPN